MEQYLHRNRLSEILDTFGMAIMLYLVAGGWFVWLWGLCLPSIGAGAALGTLFCLGRTQWRKQTVHRREKALRSRLGGELMLESMLLCEAREAHFHAAVLLAERWPILMRSVKEEGVICRQAEETLLIQCPRMPADSELSMGDLLSAQRAARRLNADRVILCVLGKVSPKMAARAEEAVLPIRIIRRETLLALAGMYAPATDEQLVSLGRRRRPIEHGHLLRLIFRPDKARRYHLYGLAMLIIYLLTGSWLYAVPGMACLTMAVMCRLRPQGRDAL